MAIVDRMKASTGGQTLGDGRSGILESRFGVWE
jgi:hypothetical protein